MQTQSVSSKGLSHLIIAEALTEKFNIQQVGDTTQEILEL